jgi:hypothetical protein
MLSTTLYWSTTEYPTTVVTNNISTSIDRQTATSSGLEDFYTKATKATFIVKKDTITKEGYRIALFLGTRTIII